MTKNATSRAAEQMYKWPKNSNMVKCPHNGFPFKAVAEKFIAMEETLKTISKMDYEELYEESSVLCQSVLSYDPIGE